MAAGLGLKTFVTGDVLTAADTNGYLMQGVWVFANAAARTAAVTSPQEGNMSFLKDTNSTEYYDGAAWVAVAGAGGGGMTLLSTTSLSGATTTVSSISGAYNQLFVELVDVYASTGTDIGLRLNTDATATAYYSYVSAMSSGDTSGAQKAPYTYKGSYYQWTIASMGATDQNNYGWALLQNYSLSTVKKTITSGIEFTNFGGNQAFESAAGAWFNSAAVTQVSVICAAAGTFSGGSIKIWGIK